MIRYCCEYEASKMDSENVPEYSLPQQVLKVQVPNCHGSQKLEDNCLDGSGIQEEEKACQESELQGNFNQEPEKNREDKTTYINDSVWVESSGAYSGPRLPPRPYETVHLVKASSEKGHVSGTNKDQEWKVVKVKQILISSIDQSRKPRISRSVSLSERELKEAKVRSQKIAAQLTTPPNASSRGVLLFNRRKQRVNQFTLEGHRAGTSEVITGDKEGAAHRNLQDHGKEGSLKHSSLDKAHLKTLLNSEKPGLRPFEDTMEENKAETESLGKKVDLQNNEDKGKEILSTQHLIQSNQESSIEEVKIIPVSVHLKENIEKISTNGIFDTKTCEQENTPLVNKEQNEVKKKQYSEVHLTLAKPVSVANRTARPFGTQSSAKIKLSTEKGPMADVPPLPTYAETLSTPPPVSSVRSPPSYSALYPTPTEQKSHDPQLSSYGEKRSTTMQKSGVLEEAMSHRSNKKSMFTFIEKPKLSPNPDLLSLVHNTDEKRKQRDQGEVVPEEEPFALGAEASNFLNDSAGKNPTSTDIVPEWSSCLKSPSFHAKPPPKPDQTLSEARGKGAELFARRQSRMERFVIESPAHHDSVRSPSPTMSLPPSWKYASNARVPSVAFNHPPKKLSRSPKPLLAHLITNNATESEQSQKELEISKRQPYQLQPSLFVLSPSKDPVSSLPKSAPPPKTMIPNSYRVTRQTSCPSSPLLHSSVVHSQDPFKSNPLSPSYGGNAVIKSQDTRRHFGGVPEAIEVPLASPVPFSPTSVMPPRAKRVIQAPRPSFSTKQAGIEPQEKRESLPASPTCTPRTPRWSGPLNEWVSSDQGRGSQEGYTEAFRVMSPPPPPPMSPSWSERSLSPLRQETDPKTNKQMQTLIARNIINAARRKSSSPRTPVAEGFRPFTPPVGTKAQPQSSSVPPWSPRIMSNHSPIFKSPLQSPTTAMTRSPFRRYTTRSPTDSDVSIDSEDSGAKSPGLRGYSICPRGWNGSLRMKRGSLPTEAPCTS